MEKKKTEQLKKALTDFIDLALAGKCDGRELTLLPAAAELAKAFALLSTTPRRPPVIVPRSKSPDEELIERAKEAYVRHLLDMGIDGLEGARALSRAMKDGTILSWYRDLRTGVVPWRRLCFSDL